MTAKQWSDGELLTAAAVNEVTLAGRLRYPSAAARDAELTAPFPGLTVFLTDANMNVTYLNIGGIAGWYPEPQTLCFAAYHTGGIALPVGWAALTTFTLSPGDKNLNNWFNPDTGRFTPQLPGLYEFNGGVSMATAPSGTSSAHRAGFRLNGTGSTAPALGSDYRQPTTTNTIISLSARRFIFAMNGTTDYVEMVAYASLATSALASSGFHVSFAGKYMGQ